MIDHGETSNKDPSPQILTREEEGEDLSEVDLTGEVPGVEEEDLQISMLSMEDHQGEMPRREDPIGVTREVHHQGEDISQTGKWNLLSSSRASLTLRKQMLSLIRMRLKGN